MTETSTQSATITGDEKRDAPHQAPVRSEKRGRPRSTGSQAAPIPSKLRDVKPRAFSPSSLQPLSYGTTEILTVDVPAGWYFGDVLNPLAWSSVVGPLAANALKTTVDRVGSLIYANTVDNRFIAWLRISAILRDDLKNPYGMEVTCIGPCIDLKTGRPRPLDLKTGLAWSDPPEQSANKAA